MKVILTSCKHCWLFVFLVVGLFAYLLPTTGYLNIVPGGLGDARFNSVVLEHVYRWVMGSEAQLWSPRFFYPYEGVLAFSDNHIGSSFSYIFFRTLGIGREHAFIGWFLVGNLLNFLSAYIVLRRFGISSFGSAAGAFVFAFALPALPKEGHGQLVHRFAIPFAVSALVDLVDARKLIAQWRVVFWVTVQFFCSIYLGLFLVYLLAAILISYAVLGRFRGIAGELYASAISERSSNLILSAFASMVCIGALLWLMYHYHAVSADYGLINDGIKDQLRSMLPRPSSYLLADFVSLSAWVGSWATDIPMRWEHQMFFGVGVSLLAAFGLYSNIKTSSRASIGNVLALALFFLISGTLYVHGYSFYLLLEDLPGMSSVRVVARIVLVMLLPVAFLVGTGSQRLYSLGKSRRVKWLTACIVIALVSTEVSSYQAYWSSSVDDWRERQEAVRNLLPDRVDANAILNVTDFVTEPAYLVELDGMILAQDLGLATLNGYSGHVPPGYGQVSPCYPNNRLEGYAAFRGISAAELKRLSDRIVHLELGPQACNRVSAEQARQIEVDIQSLDVGGGKFIAQIRVSNKSEKDLDSSSTKGAQLRISWRLVPVTNEGAALANPGWHARQDIGWVIHSGSSVETTISESLPADGARYVLEVSMVLEGEAWLHDLGMKAASLPLY